MNHNWQKNISGCGLAGIINKQGKRVSGEIIKRSICLMNDRGNGLGAGFAAYGIYPEFKDFYAFHIMYDSTSAKAETEEYIKKYFNIEKEEEIPIYKKANVKNRPILQRYFIIPKKEAFVGEFYDSNEDDFAVFTVMKINSQIDGAFVFSSGKNMGAFKGVGFPKDIAEFYRIDDYEGYIWTSHNRFPTNTPGWWGGAHPFTLLDWSIVHNGEISSYGINKRYLEMFGYKMTLLTDTEVVAYMLDLLVRRHRLPLEVACKTLAAPFWKSLQGLTEEEKGLYTAIRMVYGSALLNGPFAFLFGHSKGLVGLNDRIKLRPLIVATKDEWVIMASEESAIREIFPALDDVWAPKAGEAAIAKLNDDVVI